MANQPPSSKLEPWHDLNGKVVMVTGASSGLGRDFCLDLAKAGCKIVAAARRIDRLVSLCDEINQLGTSGNDDVTDNVRAVAVELDVSAKGPTIEASVNKAWEAFGRIDGLINNAGVRGNVHSPLELVEDEWDSTMRTNLTGTWLVSKYMCIRMRDAKHGGSIINISSIAGLDRGQLRGVLAYASSKTGVNTLTKVMAMELEHVNKSRHMKGSDVEIYHLTWTVSAHEGRCFGAEGGARAGDVEVFHGGVVTVPARDDGEDKE
ncbi:hypothetical protein L1987_59965 [Smallanthus sonchifolius]|uniref:Uncharacterized protein n=1 Tax=Smallanthus sonchifolius TaxID=185202 RepID=A0ACB9D6Z2_9ASTR|nr:hypothetical protein L1987_59965 [Smallanthus sonchifolius]